MKPYLALIAIDVRLAFRQKAVIFFNYLMPFGFFFLFAQAYHAEQGGAILQVFTMVTVIGILGNGLFGGGMRAVQEREANILRRYKVAPISPLPLLVASTVTGLVVYLPCVLLMLVVARGRYGMQMPANLGSVLLFIVLGVVAIRSIGLIIASVVNSMQESTILVQIAYMTMLFLSGASFPVAMFPSWLLVFAQFIPATYLVSGMQAILIGHQSLAVNWQAVGALALTAGIGLLLSVKLFRWEKEEKMRPASKLWVLAVLLPFAVLGSYQAYAKDNVRKIKELNRTMSRSRTALIRNARIFVGNGTVIENGAVLVKDGKIADVYNGEIPDARTLHAEAIEAAGKTILPGLIDVNVHLDTSGAPIKGMENPDPLKNSERELASYLYCGVTAVRSVGDMPDASLKTRDLVNSGVKLGAEMFATGPRFTVPGGPSPLFSNGTLSPPAAQDEAKSPRIPKTADEAKQAVDELKRLHVDAIQVFLEAGAGLDVYNLKILHALAAAARDDGMPTVVSTRGVRDVEDALNAGVNGIANGSFVERIPDSDFAAMAKKGVTYEPALSAPGVQLQLAAGDLDALNRSLVQQVVPAKVLAGARRMLEPPQGLRKFFREHPPDLSIARDNLLRAWKAGVPLVTGSDAGNMLVFHGPTTQHEMELWVAAGIPAQAALTAATLNSARALRAGERLGSIEKGKEATLLVVDGNPLVDIRATEAISFVMFKGERLNRAELLGQE